MKKVFYWEIGGEKWIRNFQKDFYMISKGDTDTISLSFDINGRQLNVEMTFSVENK